MKLDSDFINKVKPGMPLMWHVEEFGVKSDIPCTVETVSGDYFIASTDDDMNLYVDHDNYFEFSRV